MSSIEQTLLVDFLRRGRLGLLVTLPTLTFLPFMVYGLLFQGLKHDEAMRQLEAGGVGPGVFVSMHVMFTLMVGFCAATFILGVQGSLARFYSLPVSTMRLVVCQLSLSAAAGALVYLIMAAALNFFVNADWPLVGPALFVAAVLACTQATIWCTHGSLGLQFVGLCATGTALAIWFARRYGATVFGDWKVMWNSPALEEVLTLLAITAGAYALAIAGVARNRRGDSLDFEWATNWFANQLAALRRTGRFSSPRAAQFWFERQQKLVAVPAALIGLVMLISILPALTGFTPAREMLENAFVGGLTALGFVALIYGLLLGNFGRSSRMFQMTHFLGSRPLSDAVLAASILRTGGAALTAAWGVWILSQVVALAFCLKQEGSAATFGWLAAAEHPPWAYALFVLAALAGSWALLGTAASLSATGMTLRITTLVLGSLFATAVFFVGFSYVDPVYKARYDEVGCAVIGLVFLGLTGWATVRTRLAQIVPERTTWQVLVLWFVVLAGGVAAMIALARQPVPAGVWIFSAGLSSLVVLPFVAAPLGVSWNRHR